MSDADVAVGEEPDYEEKLDEKPRSILLAMMKQLKTGMDLSRVTLPTFILEPRSFLEKCSDFMAHGSIIASLGTTDDALDRFLLVTKWYLSGWHFKPPGVKKPYNPIMGEVFHCKWDYGDKGSTLYIAEQVSHHPPVSAFHAVNRKGGWMLNAALKPKSKFLGNSAASIMDGKGTLHNLVHKEVYEITYPSLYVRGLLIGVMRIEIQGDIAIECPTSDLCLKLSFKNKGYFRGTNNSVEGKIQKLSTGETIFKLEGRWDRIITITDKRTGKTSTFLDVEAEKKSSFVPLVVEPDEEQAYFESRKVWQHVTKGLRSQNYDFATQHKSKLEDGQRAGKKEREAQGHGTWEPTLFKDMTPGAEPTWQMRLANFELADANETGYEESLKKLAKTGLLSVGEDLMKELNP